MCSLPDKLNVMEYNAGQRIPPPWIGAVLGTGIVLSLSLFFVIRDWEERDLEHKAGDLASVQVGKLHVDMLRSMEVLHSITAFITGAASS